MHEKAEVVLSWLRQTPAAKDFGHCLGFVPFGLSLHRCGFVNITAYKF